MNAKTKEVCPRQTTVKVSSIKVWQCLSDLEDKLNAVGAYEEAAEVRIQKEAVLRNIAEVSDKSIPPSSRKNMSVGEIINRSIEIDWGEFSVKK